MTSSTKKDRRLSLLAAAALLALPAAVAAQDCYRHAECDGQDLCIETTCTAPEEPQDTCDGVDDCPGGSHWLCDDGFCKMDGVCCQNPAGCGYEDNEWGDYFCDTGEEYDWSAHEPQDALLADDELYDRCLESLASYCGEEPVGGQGDDLEGFEESEGAGCALVPSRGAPRGIVYVALSALF